MTRAYRCGPYQPDRHADNGDQQHLLSKATRRCFCRPRRPRPVQERPTIRSRGECWAAPAPAPGRARRRQIRPRGSATASRPPYRQRHHIEGDRCFAPQADGDNQPDGDPPAFLAGLNQPHRAPAHPSQVNGCSASVWINAIAKKIAGGESKDRPAIAPPAAQQAGKVHRQRHGGRHRQSGRKPEAQQEISEQGIRPSRDQRNQRRLIDITPVRVLATDNEMKSSRKKSMAIGDQKMDGQCGQRHKVGLVQKRPPQCGITSLGRTPKRAGYINYRPFSARQ